MNLSIISFLMLVLLMLFIDSTSVLSQISQPTSSTVIIVSGASNPATLNPFSPSILNIPVGQTVTWINNDNVFHTVTSFSTEFDSGIIESGSEYPFAFNKEGYYKYYCQLHPYMNGAIIVKWDLCVLDFRQNGLKPPISEAFIRKLSPK